MKRSERYLFPLGWALLLELVAAIPYLVGTISVPPGSHFGGFVYNPDDPYVYLSWMRQAAEGHVFIHNLFTLEPQRGVSFHLLFFLLGVLAHYLHLPLVTVYHLARVGFGILFVLILAALLAMLEQDRQKRSWMLVFTTVGSGIGWIWFLHGSPLLSGANLLTVSTDVWITETIPFLCLLLNPLFLCALCLFLGAFLCLLRGEELNSTRWAVLSGVLILLLGNIHSYDILLLHPIWIVFLTVITLRPGFVQSYWPGWQARRAWLRYAIAFVIGLPSVAYQYWVFLVEPVFHARAGDLTLSPALWYYLAGLGVLIPLSILFLWRHWKCPAILWLAVWCALGLGLPYIATFHGPVAFQRKLAIGLDIPYLVLSSSLLSGWIVWLQRKAPLLGIAPGVIVALLLSATNLCFYSSVLRMAVTGQTTVMAPMQINGADMDAISWLRLHHRPGDRVLCLPWIGNVLPAETGCSVYVGHWGETENFGQKLGISEAFFSGKFTNKEADQFVKQNRIRYIYVGSIEKMTLAKNPTTPNWIDQWPNAKLVVAADSGQESAKIYRITGL